MKSEYVFMGKIYRCRLVLILCLLCVYAHCVVFADENEEHIAIFSIEGAIGPATSDYFIRALARAIESGAIAGVLQIDTPGGLDASMRDIIKAILDSPIPIISYVYPSGARAASAGTYILYASHIAAMAPSTTLGAATPVKLGHSLTLADAQQEPQSDNVDNASSVMKRKMTNDAVAFIRGLAQRHHRNADWAELAVSKAATLTASEALEKNVVDVVAADITSVLAAVEGRKVVMAQGEIVLQTQDAKIKSYSPDWRNRFLAIITNPQIAYILLLVGIYGLLFEGYSPGALVPGVVGLICLLLGLYAMQILPINYVGLTLIIFGALLMAAEAFVPSFGVLGLGGLVALVFGSFMLMDTDVPGMVISRQVIGGVAIAGSFFLILLVVFVGRHVRQTRPDANQALVGQRGIVATYNSDVFQVRIQGEIWRAVCDTPLAEGDTVLVMEQNGLTLRVHRTTE